MATIDVFRPGDIPLSRNERCRTTQAKQLRDNAGENRPSFRFLAVAPLIEGTIELCDKALNQPTPADLKAAMH